MSDFQKKIQEMKTASDPLRKKTNDTLDRTNKELQEAVQKLRERLGRKDLETVTKVA